MGRKNKMGVLCLLMSCLWLTACQGSVLDTESQMDTNLEETESNESELDTTTESECTSEKENVVMKEVVFLNRMYSMEDMEFNAWEGGFSGIHIMLDWDIEYDEDTLFAYTVGWNDPDGSIPSENKEKVINILKREGFIFLQEYPGDKVVIAVPIKVRLGEVFLYEKQYEGYYLDATSAMRPDMEDILKEFCGAENYDESMYEYEWFEENFEELVPLLGTDKNYVKLTVPVIMPEENFE